MTKYARFRKQEQEQEISEKGYTIVPSFLNAEHVQQLTALYGRYHNPQRSVTSDIHVAPNDRGGYWSSLHSLNSNDSVALSEQVLDIVKPELAKIFDDWSCPIGAMLSKYTGDKSQFDAHRDGSVLDESKFGYRNLWMPLVDVNETNGALYVVPKSHLHLGEIWPMVSNGAHWPYTAFNDIVERYAKTIYVNRGDLIVYDQGLMHGSWPNHSEYERPVVHFGILPSDYQMVFYKVEAIAPRISVTAYKVNPDFYFEKQCDSSLLIEENIAFKREFNYKKYTSHEFENLMRELLA